VTRDYDYTLKNCLARNNVHMMCIPIAPGEDDPFIARTADSTVDEVMHILMSQTRLQSSSFALEEM
jgi:hypothetical protein